MRQAPRSPSFKIMNVAFGNTFGTEWFLKKSTVLRTMNGDIVHFLMYHFSYRAFTLISSCFKNLSMIKVIKIQELDWEKMKFHLFGMHVLLHSGAIFLDFSALCIYWHWNFESNDGAITHDRSRLGDIFL